MSSHIIIQRNWWARQDSNLQPNRYERLALTIELQAPLLKGGGAACWHRYRLSAAPARFSHTSAPALRTSPHTFLSRSVTRSVPSVRRPALAQLSCVLIKGATCVESAGCAGAESQDRVFQPGELLTGVEAGDGGFTVPFRQNLGIGLTAHPILPTHLCRVEHPSDRFYFRHRSRIIRTSDRSEALSWLDSLLEVIVFHQGLRTKLHGNR
ncbi:hypothetical protein ACVISU_005719 [Bradyrhizobium sp. USDA 4452]